MRLAIDPPAITTLPIAGADPDLRFPVRRVYCVGRNYAEHAIEMGHSGREAPFFFMKPGDAVLPIDAETVGRMHYPALTRSLHFELELVVAIGKRGANIAVDDALGHVWGYGVGLDMTRRDLQADAKKMGRPWDLAKGFDEAAPIGPLRRAAECSIGPESAIVLEVNGQPRQKSVLGKMIWSVAEVIAHLSTGWTLMPGDLIFSGTPEGVSATEVGDTLVGRVDGVGGFRLEIVAS